MIEGLVHQGINRIFTVVDNEGNSYLCTFKGKKLKGVDRSQNPIVAGDRVTIEPDPIDPHKGQILSRLPRTNQLQRWNAKRRITQTICANIDLLVCVTTPDNPPFRPRFIDRVGVAAYPDIPVLVVLNKCDLGVPHHVEARLIHYKTIGMRVVETSALAAIHHSAKSTHVHAPFEIPKGKADPSGIEHLRAAIHGKTVAFVGQSGVGKSSLLNALYPGIDLAVGDISHKYNRGTHTTNYGVLIPQGETTIIDTPGVREFLLGGLELHELGFAFPEFEQYAGACKFQPCLHDSEPHCKVKQAYEEGLIEPDRYTTYLFLLDEIRDHLEHNHGKS